jgi:hypothetical protein
MTEMDLLLAQIDQAYNRRSRHGAADDLHAGPIQRLEWMREDG